MAMSNKILLFIILFCIIAFAQQNIYKFPDLTGPYLGQKPPGIKPEIFAPLIISTFLNERDIAIAPGGNEIYYGLTYSRTVTIMVTRLVNGKWLEPQAASFASDPNYFNFEPCISSDGSKFFFLTTRPIKGRPMKPGWTYSNIFLCDRKPDGSWGAPYDPGENINSDSLQYYPSITDDGTLYFTRTSLTSKKTGIFRSRYINGKYQHAEPLPDAVNNNGNPFNAFIAHDESYLIACVDGRTDNSNPGKTNYYIYFRDKNDNWSEGIAFGPEINIKGTNASSAYVTRDGKYMFFASQKLGDKYKTLSEGLTISQILEMNTIPKNGNSDIYWVDAGIIESLKPGLKPVKNND